VRQYPKPLWIVLNPKAAMLGFEKGPIVAGRERDALNEAEAWSSGMTGAQRMPWREMYRKGYRCVKAKLSWEEACPKS
jgi:hypothetical protein